MYVIATSQYPESEWLNSPRYLQVRHPHSATGGLRETSPPARGSLQPASPPPPQRDTVFVPPSEDGIIPGWAKVVYYSGTAGVWPIHCHIDWHMSAGLMAFIVEDAPKLARASAELSPAFL